jgi:hypothetical protein
MAEASLLSFFAPSARPLAPQVTALPPLAAYHDLRWLFVFNQPWLGFTGMLVLLLAARSAVDAVLLRLAWPDEAEPSLPRPRFLPSVLSCAVLTLLAWLLMSPVVTLMFGVALLPFSWPYLAALPILLGTAVALSQGGVGQAWWRRLPPVRTAAWLLFTFAVLSAASVLMSRLDAAAAVAVAGLAGLVDARAWYGLTAAAVRRSARGGRRGGEPPRARGVPGGRPPGLALVPVAPLAAVMVLVVVVGMARLAFTGALRFPAGASNVVAASGSAGGSLAAASGSVATGSDSDSEANAQSSSNAAGSTGASGAKSASSGSGAGAASGDSAAGGATSRAHGAVLVVGGFGSSCCQDASTLRAAEPGMLVRQFSYQGLNRAGLPIAYHRAGNLPIQVLGDRMAAQVNHLYQESHTPVDIVAESEGTLGLYAMLARHPHVPVGSVVLLSPIVEPDQVAQTGAAVDTVPGQALLALNDLVGGISPYGTAGARALIDSVSEVGASYFATVTREQSLPWLAVVPLADAVTLPACSWPTNVIFVDALHGGLLGDADVQRMIETFLVKGTVSGDVKSQPGLHNAARIIAAAATAWRMPELRSACPS